jgi:chromate reductase
MHLTIYNGMDNLPHFSPDRDFEYSPASVLDLREQLKGADAVIICTPEYAFGMSGSLKNLLDWTVSSGEFVNKPVAAWSASPLQTGGSKAHAWLIQVLGVLTAEIVIGASLNIPFIKTRMDADGEVADAAISVSLTAALAALANAVLEKKIVVE